jgi:hypothetical protein
VNRREFIAGLGVQSRSEVGSIVSEAIRLVCACVADAFVGSEASATVDGGAVKQMSRRRAPARLVAVRFQHYTGQSV